MEMNENKWNVRNLIWEQHGGNEMKSFYNNITIRPHFKINGLIYRGILRVLVKKLLNLIPFPPISPNFRGNEYLWF